MSNTATAKTEEILREDGAEAALIELAEEVKEAEEAIRTVLSREKGRVWMVRELQDAAAEGFSASVMSIAYLRLLKAGELEVNRSNAQVKVAA